MIFDSKTTFCHLNLKLLRQKVTKNLRILLKKFFFGYDPGSLIILTKINSVNQCQFDKRHFVTSSIPSIQWSSILSCPQQEQLQGSRAWRIHIPKDLLQSLKRNKLIIHH